MESFYKTYKPAWKSFYKLFFLILLLIVLGAAANHFKPGESWLKFMWIVIAAADILILLYIAAKRWTMTLVLKDNPAKAEDQEIAFSECNPLKPFSSDFRKSIEIGLSSIIHIEVKQTLMQTLLRVGDVVIASSGTGKEEIYAPDLPSPNEVRDEIQLHAKKYKSKSED